MSEIVKLRKNLFKHVAIIGIVVSSVLFLIGKNDVAFGYLVGCVASVINFYLLSVDIKTFQSRAHGKMVKILIVRYFLRYLCIGLMFVGAVIYKIHIIAFAVGFFVCHLILLIHGIRTTRGAQ